MAGWSDADEWAGLKDGSRCPICLNNGPLDVLVELNTTWVTAPARIPLPGYLCVVSKHHVVEPFELPEQESHAFWEETLLVATALNEEFEPIKMNYEIHGNTIPHLHVHLFPRFQDDPFENGPIDPRMHAHERPPEELERLSRMSEGLVSR